jgi:hypothetical protein
MIWYWAPDLVMVHDHMLLVGAQGVVSVDPESQLYVCW